MQFGNKHCMSVSPSLSSTSWYYNEYSSLWIVIDHTKHTTHLAKRKENPEGSQIPLSPFLFVFSLDSFSCPLNHLSLAALHISRGIESLLPQFYLFSINQNVVARCGGASWQDPGGSGTAEEMLAMAWLLRFLTVWLPTDQQDSLPAGCCIPGQSIRGAVNHRTSSW